MFNTPTGIAGIIQKKLDIIDIHYKFRSLVKLDVAVVLGWDQK